MFSQLLTPPYAPFALAFIVMIGVGLIEAIGLGLGAPDLDVEVGADVQGGLLDWLGLGGELPILIWLTSLLGCFTISGIALQQTATALTGVPLHWAVATGGALAVAAMLNIVATRGLTRIMPRFESTAIETDDLLRRRGIIMEGAARRGAPARGKIVDQFGQAHFVMVEPHDDTDVISAGQTALLVRRSGALFLDFPTTARFLRHSEEHH